MSISPLLQGVSTNKVAGSNFQTNFYLSKNTLNNHSYVIWASISDQQQNDSGDIFYGVGNSFSLGVSPSDHRSHNLRLHSKKVNMIGSLPPCMSTALR